MIQHVGSRKHDPKFGIGDRVVKPKGYPFPGTIQGIVVTRADNIRYVVEHECGDLLHIFNEGQIEHDRDHCRD